MTFRFDITDAEFSEYMKHFYKKRFTLSKNIWIYVVIALVFIVVNSYNSAYTQGDEGNTLSTLLNWLLLLGLMAGSWFLVTRMLVKNVKIQSEKKTTFIGKYWIYMLIAVVLIGVNTYTWNSSKAEISTDSSPDYIQPLLSWLFLLGLVAGCWFFILRRLTTINHTKPEDRETLLGEREMTFNDNRIEFKGSTAESTYRWEAIKKWEQTTQLYLLFITDNSAIILPKRVFVNAEQQAEFEQLIRRKLPNLTSDKYLDA